MKKKSFEAKIKSKYSSGCSCHCGIIEKKSTLNTVICKECGKVFRTNRNTNLCRKCENKLVSKS